MKVFPLNRSGAKIFTMLAVTLSAAGFINSARADDIPASDPAAPCGVLHLIGQESAIYNPSVFNFNVQFVTTAVTHHGWLVSRSINAGAVKYLEKDPCGGEIWRDTGRGDYRSTKTYTVPVKAKSTVTIAYCGSRVPNVSYIAGNVFFTANPDEPLHPIPDGIVNFRGWADWTDWSRNWDESHAINRQVWFDTPGFTPYVHFNRKPDTSWEDGSLTICPNDPVCQIP